MPETRYAGQLDLGQYRTGNGLALEFDIFSLWENHGYPVEEIREAHSVVSHRPDSENGGHIVAKVETLSKPLSSADAVSDMCSVWCCDCKDYQFNQAVDLEDTRLPEWGYCKHIETVSKAARAANDEAQVTLVD